MPSIPILTYHALNIDGNDYLGNDHVAFREDLRLLTSLGFRIIPLADLVQLLVDPNGAWPVLPRNAGEIICVLVPITMNH